MKTVIKWQNGMVMVFNSRRRQIPAYQGMYEDVKDKILKDALPTTEFYHGNGPGEGKRLVSREEW